MMSSTLLSASKGDTQENTQTHRETGTQIHIHTEHQTHSDPYRIPPDTAGNTYEHMLTHTYIHRITNNTPKAYKYTHTFTHTQYTFTHRWNSQPHIPSTIVCGTLGTCCGSLRRGVLGLWPQKLCPEESCWMTVSSGTCARSRGTWPVPRAGMGWALPCPALLLRLLWIHRSPHQ